MVFKNRNIQWFLWAVFMGLSVLFIASAVVFYNFNKTAIKEERYHELSAITSLKQQQIQKWIRERKSDAFFFYYNPAFHLHASRLGNMPRSEEARKVVHGWIYPLFKSHSYRSVSLWDDNNNLVYLVGDSSHLDELSHHVSSHALPDTVSLSDLYFFNDHIVMDLLARINVPGNSQPWKLLFHVDPYVELFPLIQTWPTPSRSAESLLLKSAGDSILYLNELRHRSNTALRLKLPIEGNYTAAQMVAAKLTGIAEGIDYRGTNVILNVMKLNHLNWYLVGKVDEDEVYESIRRSAYLILVFTIILIGAAGVSIYIFYNQLKVKQYRELFEKEQERAQAVQRYETITRNANDAIIISDENGNLLEVNLQAEQLFGYTQQELLTKNLADLRTPAYAAKVSEHLRRAEEEGGIRTQIEYIRKDGALIIAEVSSKIIHSAGAKYFVGIIRDITKNIADRKRIEKLNRFNVLMNEINELIIRIDNEEVLLRKACQTAVEYGGFVLVWIGIKTAQNTLRPIASAGPAQNFISGLNIQNPDASSGRGELMRALLEGKVVYINNLPEDPSVIQWKEHFEAFGIGSTAGVPLNLHRQEKSFIAFYVKEKEFFSDEELALLKRISANLSYAVEKIHIDQMRIRAEKERQISEKNYASIAANIPRSDVYLYDRDMIIQLADGSEMKKIGLGNELYIGKRIDKLLAFEQNGLPGDFFVRVLWGEELKAEIRLQEYVYTVSGIPVRDEEGIIRGGIALITDISEEKRAEQAIIASEEKFRNLINQLPDSVMLVNSDTIITYASPAALELFGLTEENYWTHSFTSFIVGRNEQEQDIIRSRVLSGFEVKGYERFKKFSGEEFYAEFSARLTSTGVIQVVMRDITERRKNEQLIWQKTEQLQALFNTGRFYMGIVEMRGNEAYVVMLNDAFTRFTGHEPGSLNGKCVSVYSESEEEYRSWVALFEQCRNNNQTLSFVAPFKIAGPDFYLQTSISQIDYPGEYDTFSFISFDISDRMRYERELIESQESLHKLATHLQIARENERIGIAREMHDELGQLLTAIKMNVAYLAREFRKGKFGEGKEDVVAELEVISSTVDRSVKGVRRLITQLRPEILDNLGLYSAIEWLVQDFKEKTVKEAEFINKTGSPELGKDVSLALFRIVQECLTNVIKHAEANRVTITFAREGAGYQLQIVDDGKGFSPEGKKAGKQFGLMGINERMYIFGGEVTVKSEKGKGTAILVRFPAEAVSDDLAEGTNKEA